MEGYYDNPGIFLNQLLLQDEESEFEEEFKWLQDALKKVSQSLRGQNEQTVEFIGAHPKSLSKAKLQQIKREFHDWLVCEKTDGVRFLLLILSNGHCYFTGRNLGGISTAVNSYQLHRVRIKVPSQLVNPQQLEIIEMFDGELIIDNYPNNNQVLNYLMFDTLIHNRTNVCGHSYFDRLRCAQEFLELRKVLKNLAPMAEIDFMPLNNLPKLKCILKDFFMIAQVRYIFNNYIPLLPHGNDGLIFTKNSFPYKSGTNENIVKWKPPEKNTIDFLICPNTKITVTNPNFGLLELYVFFSQKQQKHLFLFDFIYVPISLVNEIKKEISNQIDRLEEIGQIQAVKGIVAECKLEKLAEKQEMIAKLFNHNNYGFDSSHIEQFFLTLLKYSELACNLEEGLLLKQVDFLKEIREAIHLKYNFKFSWAVEKYRTDKTSPNSIMVAQNLLQIISEDLKQAELIDILEKQETF